MSIAPAPRPPADARAVKLWLDDVRPAPEGWDWCKTVDEAVDLMLTQATKMNGAGGWGVIEASLDHDLGEGEVTGLAFVDWMIDHGVLPMRSVTIHSWNQPGARRMAEALHRSGYHHVRCEVYRARRPS